MIEKARCSNHAVFLLCSVYSPVCFKNQGKCLFLNEWAHFINFIIINFYINLLDILLSNKIILASLIFWKYESFPVSVEIKFFPRLFASTLLSNRQSGGFDRQAQPEFKKLPDPSIFSIGRNFSNPRISIREKIVSSKKFYQEMIRSLQPLIIIDPTKKIFGLPGDWVFIYLHPCLLQKWTIFLFIFSSRQHFTLSIDLLPSEKKM